MPRSVEWEISSLLVLVMGLIFLFTPRAWVTAHGAVPNAVILQKDIRNAFNEVQPRQFLADCRNHAPAFARFAHFCYGTSTNLMYEGGHRGQQGCPLMGPMFGLTSRRMFEEARVASARPPPEFEVAFADDAYSGGDVADVLAAFRTETALSCTYGLHFDLGKCKLHLLAGEQFRGDVSKFQALGV